MVDMSTQKNMERKRTLLWVGVFTFLFHSVFPYYHAVAGESAEGYTTTICTAYGYKTVFVAFDKAESQSTENSSYYECPTCLVQANATGWIDSYGPLFEALLPQSEEERGGERLSTPAQLHYPSFLIRGPPA